MAFEERVPRRRIACGHFIERRVTSPDQQFFPEYVAMARKDVSFLVSAIPGPNAVKAEAGLPFARWLQRLGGDTDRSAGVNKRDAALLQPDFFQDRDRPAGPLK